MVTAQRGGAVDHHDVFGVALHDLHRHRRAQVNLGGRINLGDFAIDGRGVGRVGDVTQPVSGGARFGAGVVPDDLGSRVADPVAVTVDPGACVAVDDLADGKAVHLEQGPDPALAGVADVIEMQVAGHDVVDVRERGPHDLAQFVGDVSRARAGVKSG